MKYRKWTEEEDRILEECCMLYDRPIDEAVRRLDRSRQAIRNRVYNLGLTGMYRKEDKTFPDAERWDLCNRILNKAKELYGKPVTDPKENPYRKIQEVGR